MIRHAPSTQLLVLTNMYTNAQMRFRVRANSYWFEWGPWNQISEYMQTSPSRPARPSMMLPVKSYKGYNRLNGPFKNTMVQN